MANITFTAQIFNELTKLYEKMEKLNPDTKHNAGRLIGRAHIWDMVAKYAKKQSEAAWKVLESEEIVSYVDSEGDHTLAESPHFIIADRVSLPRKTFSPDALAKALKAKYRVPLPTSKEMIEEAKLPGNRTHTTVTMERNV